MKEYLGVTITGDLKWSSHCYNVSRRATRTLNLLRRTLYGCSREVKKTSYLALVRPHLEYCAPVWLPHTEKDRHWKSTETSSSWVCSKWNPATFSWSNTYEDELLELNWVSVTKRHEALSLCQAYKIVNSLDCINLQTTLHYLTGPHVTAVCCVVSSQESMHSGTPFLPEYRSSGINYQKRSPTSATSYPSFNRTYHLNITWTFYFNS